MTRHGRGNVISTFHLPAHENIKIELHVPRADRKRLEQLPWHAQLEEWEELGVELLVIRRGASRHPVVFVECDGARYAIKETTPHMADREIRNLREIERRGIPALSPIGVAHVSAPPLSIEVPGIPGMRQRINNDRGYTITRLAPRVIPHVLLYRLPLKKRSKHSLLSAIAVLMIELHEHGIYWGDPSLANALIRIDGRRVLAIMADAETTEIFPQAVSEGLRQQDLAHFGESLAWQAEDLRQARGLSEDEQVLDDKDFRYFERRYRWLKREHARLGDEHHFDTLFQAQKFLQSLNRWGFSLLDMTGRAMQQFTTVLPGWYQRRIYELIHVSIPRPYARRFYNLILGHQALLSEQVHRPVKLEVAARDWYQRYHLPTILLLRQSLTQDQDPMQIYFAIMDHKWNLSLKAGREISLEDSLVDFSMERAQSSELGAVDPARIATWWRERSPVSEALANPSIESEELEPLVATSERPLVRLQQPELEQKLPAILHKSQQPKKITTQDLEDPKA